MDTIFSIALLFTGHDWVEAFHRHCSNTGDLTIRSLVYDTSALSQNSFDACVVADSHPGLNQGFVQTLHERKQQVICISDSHSQHYDYLSKIGVDAIFSHDLPARELANQIIDFLTTTKPVQQQHSELNGLTSLDTFDTPDLAPSHHKVISFISTGGSGASHVSLACARLIKQSVLVDADFDKPSLSLILQADINPNILDALESSQHDIDSFDQQSQHTSVGNFIAGVSHSSFAVDIRSDELELLIHSSRQTYENTLIDVGYCTPYSSFDSHKQAILRNTHTAVLVAEPTPVGLLRLYESLAYISSLGGTQDINLAIVFNKHTGNNEIKTNIRREILNTHNIDFIEFLPYIETFQSGEWHLQGRRSKRLLKATKTLCTYLETTAIASNPTTDQHDDSSQDMRQSA